MQRLYILCTAKIPLLLAFYSVIEISNNDCLDLSSFLPFPSPHRSVGTFGRALDCSSSVRQPSLHMSAAAASRDITLVSLVIAPESFSGKQNVVFIKIPKVLSRTT